MIVMPKVCYLVSTFKHKPTLSEATWALIRPIFIGLSDQDLLSRCIGGFTQNRNESLNSIIWRYAPKKTYSGYDSLRIAVAIATIKFNDGGTEIVEVLRDLGLKPHELLLQFVHKEDNQRERSKHKVQNASIQHSDDDSDSDHSDPYGRGIAD